MSYRIVSVAPPGFCNREEMRYRSIGGLEYEVPQSRSYCLCINVAVCSTALQCICRVIRRSFMTMKAHTYCIIFGRPPIWGKLPPLAAPLHRIVKRREPTPARTRAYSKRVLRTNCALRIKKCAPRISSGIYF